jgi:nanoRNase/pAp phosphatase (c-di-AMP/oligoRNAs hydrolase)
MNADNMNGSMEQLIQSSSNIAVIPSQAGEVDAFAAALGLYLSLKERGKKVSLILTGKTPEGFEDLILAEDMVTNLSLRDLVVEINYSDSAAEKVNYSTQDGTLVLDISPVDRNFDLSNVKASLKGMEFDLIFVIGVQYKEQLGTSYLDLQEEFKKSKVVNVDISGRNTRFGDLNIVDSTIGNLSQLVMNILAREGLVITREPAKALLKGISRSLAK